MTDIEKDDSLPRPEPKDINLVAFCGIVLFVAYMLFAQLKSCAGASGEISTAAADTLEIKRIEQVNRTVAQIPLDTIKKAIERFCISSNFPAPTRDAVKLGYSNIDAEIVRILALRDKLQNDSSIYAGRDKYKAEFAGTCDELKGIPQKIKVQEDMIRRLYIINCFGNEFQ